VVIKISQYLNLIGLPPKKINDTEEVKTTKQSSKNYYTTIRKGIIEVIEDFMDGNGFPHYYERFFKRQIDETGREVGMTYSDMARIYVSYGFIPKAIKEIVTLAPTFDNFNIIDKTKVDVLKDFIKKIRWNSLYSEIIETLETKGDFFLYWYYEGDNPIPFVRVLESKYVFDIITDESGNIEELYYKKTYAKKIGDKETGEVQTIHYPVTIIFGKGYIRINDKYNYPETGYKILYNKEFEKDVVRVVRVSSFKKHNNTFSDIPAVAYIDPSLIMDNITSDLRYINRLASFPIHWIWDSDIDTNNSSFLPGGLVYGSSKVDVLASGRQGFIKQTEIQNELKSLQFERDIVNKDFYKKTALIREELEEIMGTSDSSKVLEQLRLMLSNKYEKYFYNIRDGFNPLFVSILKSLELYNEDEDKNVSFAPPEIFINTSILDTLSIMNTKLALGLTTMKEEWDKQGMTEKQQEERKENINNEYIENNKDISIEDSVKGMSNEFKQDKNIKGGIK